MSSTWERTLNRFHLSKGRGRSRLRTDVSITNSGEGLIFCIKILITHVLHLREDRNLWFRGGENNSNSFFIFYQVQPLSLALSLGERTSFTISIQDRSRNKVRDDRCWWHLENMSSRTEDENKSLIVKLKFWVARSKVFIFFIPLSEISKLT